MLSKQEIEELVREWIKVKEITGTRAGGSGHLSEVDYELEKIHEPIPSDRGWEVHFDYTVYISTEFTYYPDNPPYEYPRKGTLEFDRDGNILSEKEEGEW